MECNWVEKFEVSRLTPITSGRDRTVDCLRNFFQMNLQCIDVMYLFPVLLRYSTGQCTGAPYTTTVARVFYLKNRIIRSSTKIVLWSAPFCWRTPFGSKFVGNGLGVTFHTWCTFTLVTYYYSTDLSRICNIVSKFNKGKQVHLLIVEIFINE